ncbi:hypothetical protein LSH36_292g00066 [Paralvinella palmiformis]|uniref:Sm domain-containing protein n=1 Tax=Paralvinella palmiformis TaxID=53620 RepID=A0AAD9JIY0_9ANNE|nr:hypothetical protein LSH36_292g00066 [Paralvinella palmiformis]
MKFVAVPVLLINLTLQIALWCTSSDIVLILKLVDKCIGSKIHIIMKSDKEIVGTLLGFDDFVSILFQASLWLLPSRVHRQNDVLWSNDDKYLSLFYFCKFCSSRLIYASSRLIYASSHLTCASSRLIYASSRLIYASYGLRSLANKRYGAGGCRGILVPGSEGPEL